MLCLRSRPGFGMLLGKLVVAGWVTALWGTSIAAAQGEAGEAETMFRHLDTNKDGKLTMGDAADNNRRMLEQIFEMSGKPRSGSVSRAEFQQVFEKHKAGRGKAPRDCEPSAPSHPEATRLPPVFRQLDGDGDHRISRAELSRLGQIFDRLDSNRDGQLDAGEIQAAERDDEDQPVANQEKSRPHAPAERPAGRNRPRENSARGSETVRPANAAKLEGIWRGWVVDGRGEKPNEGQMEIELTITGNRITGRELGTQRAGRHRRRDVCHDGGRRIRESRHRRNQRPAGRPAFSRHL